MHVHILCIETEIIVHTPNHDEKVQYTEKKYFSNVMLLEFEQTLFCN